MYARRSHGDFFLTCSKFDGARSARGVCRAHLGDSTTYVWRTRSVNEDPRTYVAYLPRICYFFVHRASAVASPASGTGALDLRAHKCFWNAPLDGTVGLAFNVITTLDGLCLSLKVLLTYWGQNKMAAILQTFLFPFPWMKTFKWNVTEICPPVFDRWCCSIGSDNGLAPTGAKPLSEPMMVCFTDACMRHLASMG